MTLPLAEQKFLILIKFSLSISSFIDCTFDVIFEKSPPYPSPPRFSPMLSCVVLCFAYRPIIHFQLIFVKDVSSVSRLTFFICEGLVFSSPFVALLNCLQASLIAQLVKNPPAMQEIPVRFLGQEDPLEKG